jgi:hypothetical protein
MLCRHSIYPEQSQLQAAIQANVSDVEEGILVVYKHWVDDSHTKTVTMGNAVGDFTKRNLPSSI